MLYWWIFFFTRHAWLFLGFVAALLLFLQRHHDHKILQHFFFFFARVLQLLDAPAFFDTRVPISLDSKECTNPRDTLAEPSLS